MIIKTASPDAYAVFFPFDQEDTTKLAKGQDDVATRPLIIKNDIIAISTTKPKTGIGQWSLTLAPAKPYKSMISPGNWCLIYISDRELSTEADVTEKSGLKILGIVKSVRSIESVDPETGTRTLRYQISGEDFQTILNVMIYVNAALKTLADGADPLYQNSIVLLGDRFKNIMSPAQLIRAILDSVLGEAFVEYEDGAKLSVGARAGMPYKIPPAVAKRLIGRPVKGNQFVHMMTQSIQQNLIGKINLQPEIGSLISLWSLIQTYCNRILNECYTDLMPFKAQGRYILVPTFVMRAIPFNGKELPKFHSSTLSLVRDGNHARTDDDIKKNGQHLYVSRFISEEDIIAINYGKSDLERFNFFLVTSNQAEDTKIREVDQLGKLIDVGGGVNQLADTHSLSRYGLRPFITNSMYLVPLEAQEFLVTMNKICKDMWKRAHLYENGSVTLRGVHEIIPVGTNIVFKERKWIAHVESVSHTFSVTPEGVKTFRTTIAFVRLQTQDGAPLAAANAENPDAEFQRGSTKVQGGQ